jgi:hypothetical protein
MPLKLAESAGEGAAMKLPKPNTTTDTKPAPAVPAALVALPDHAVLTLEQLRALLGLKKNTLGREVRLGRLRVSRRAGRYFTTGSWIHQWLAEGELKPRHRPDLPVANGAAGH